jgi:lactoylglutathione lyase
MRTLHVGLRVADLERSLAFYIALGYEVLGQVPETELGSLTMLKLPGDEFVTIELVHDPSRGTVDPGGLSHVVISVDSMQATVADLTDRGVRVEPPVSPDGSEDFLTALITDPDGYRIELVQWPAGHPEGMTAADVTNPGAGAGAGAGA